MPAAARPPAFVVRARGAADSHASRNSGGRLGLGRMVAEIFRTRSPPQIAAASGINRRPRSACGLRAISFWTAPMPRYAPPFLKSPAFGYLLSAMAGTGLILLLVLLGGWMLAQCGPDECSFIERTIASLMAASERAAIAEQVAFSAGALQRVDPRVKVAGLVRFDRGGGGIAPLARDRGVVRDCGRSSGGVSMFGCAGSPLGYGCRFCSSPALSRCRRFF